MDDITAQTAQRICDQIGDVKCASVDAIEQDGQKLDRLDRQTETERDDDRFPNVFLRHKWQEKPERDHHKHVQ